MQVLGVVVLYFPGQEISKNIESFRHGVDELITIDNSHNNVGVAAALNQALNKAIVDDYDWLLTMDQDSFFTEGSLLELKEVAYLSDEKIAWVSPFHKTSKSKATPSARTTDIPIAMTSGSFLRVSACKQAGFFEEKLFIDSVDNEYCLRLRKLGFRIRQANHSVLEHSLGSVKERRFLFFRFQTTTHDAARRYYITRNMLYVMSLYPMNFFLFGMKELVKSFMLIVLFENDKVKKLHYLFSGVFDFMRGRYGPH